MANDEFGAAAKTQPTIEETIGKLKAGPTRDVVEALLFEVRTLTEQVEAQGAELALIKRTGVVAQAAATDERGTWKDPEPLSDEEMKQIEEQKLRPKVAPPRAYD